MVIDISEFNWMKDTFLVKKGKRDILLEKLDANRKQVEGLRKKIKDGEKARHIIQEVAQQTQQNLEFHISRLVTTALGSVFPIPPKFVVQITIRRNKTECDLLFEEFGTLNNPIDSSGGGPLDVASFALRITYWSLKKNRPTMILDEPFKFVSPDLQHKVSEMIKMISEKLGLQIIMVSHAEEINYSADKTFEVSKEDQFSTVSISESS